MPQTAIYPGSFDPVTFGHVDLIKRASKIFDHVVIAIAKNVQKRPLFTLEERLEMLRTATKGIKGVKVITFEGLVTEYARRNKIKVIIRGLRVVSDFEYEFQMALTNRRLAEDIETVFLMPGKEYLFLHSGLVKEIAGRGGDVSSLVPPPVVEMIKKRFQ